MEIIPSPFPLWNSRSRANDAEETLAQYKPVVHTYSKEWAKQHNWAFPQMLKRWRVKTALKRSDPAQAAKHHFSNSRKNKEERLTRHTRTKWESDGAQQLNQFLHFLVISALQFLFSIHLQMHLRGSTAEGWKTDLSWYGIFSSWINSLIEFIIEPNKKASKK